MTVTRLDQEWEQEPSLTTERMSPKNESLYFEAGRLTGDWVWTLIEIK